MGHKEKSEWDSGEAPAASLLIAPVNAVLESAIDLARRHQCVSAS